MIWSVVLIMSTSYMFGICILQGCTTYLQTQPIEEAVHEDIVKYWGSVPKAMLALFMASTSGESWSYIAEPLRSVGPLFYSVFLLYLAFFFFVVTNTLTRRAAHESLRAEYHCPRRARP